MGSRIMHLAISEALLKQEPELDRTRFLTGSLLPDAAVSGNSHRKQLVCEGKKKTYDLTGFRSSYAEQMGRDALYLGFYLHLVQDLIFRRFVYTTHRWDPRPAGNIERLHRDYAIINPYLIRRYGLSPIPELPELPGNEPLLEGCRYEAEAFFRELRLDFAARPEGESFFFQREMADDYIARAIRACLAELTALRTGQGFLDERSLAWERTGT